MKDKTYKEYKKEFSKMKCPDCKVSLIPSHKDTCSGNCRFPMCPKCKGEFGILAS